MAVKFGGRGFAHAARSPYSSLSPVRLFSGGAQGFWLDTQDLTTMFQDAAGTVPAAVGQVVMLRRDKSGRGNHFTQATLANAPILRQEAWGAYYLEYDGVNDFYQSSATVNLTASDKVSVFAGVRKTSDAAAAFVIEHSASLVTNAGSFFMTAPQTPAAQNFAFKSRGSVNTAGNSASGTLAAPYSAILTGLGDIAGDNAALRVNGLAQAATVVDQGAGNFGNYTTYIGARAGTGSFLTGRDYGFIVVGKACTADEVAASEAFVNRYVKAY